MPPKQKPPPKRIYMIRDGFGCLWPYTSRRSAESTVRSAEKYARLTDNSRGVTTGPFQYDLVSPRKPRASRKVGRK